MRGCKTCMYNRERTLKEKTCLKGYRALYGFGCRDYKSKEVNKYKIGQQVSIYDILDELERID